MPLEHVMFGGTHDLAFDSTEDWNTVGANIPVTLHYALDITSSTAILGQATATAAWPAAAARTRTTSAVTCRPSEHSGRS
jgi:hypothetical protein